MLKNRCKACGCYVPKAERDGSGFCNNCWELNFRIQYGLSKMGRKYFKELIEKLIIE